MQAYRVGATNLSEFVYRNETRHSFNLNRQKYTLLTALLVQMFIRYVTTRRP